MTSLFYIIVSLCLIIFQTIIRPGINALDGFYDLLAPFVIYLTLFRPLRESFPVVVCLGAVMDTISGGPFGLYTTTYLWLFLGIRWLVKFLRVGNTLLLPIVIMLGVLVENLVFLGSFILTEPASGSQVPEGAFRIVSEQVIWAMFTGVFLLGLIHILRTRWDKWYHRRRVKKGIEEE